MAIRALQTIVGVDTAKIEVVTHRTDVDELEIVPNNRPLLKQWLQTLPANSAIAIEATNIYHMDTVELAYEMGHQVYVVDGYRLSNYRKGIGGRAKTDASDARLLSQYLKNEMDDLRPW